MMRRATWLREGPLANRNYTLFLGGAFVSSIGSWMQTVALGWTVLQLGNSTFLLGLLGFVQMVPVLLLGAVGGALADRVDRRKFLFITQAIAAAFGAILTVLQFTGRATIPVLLVVAAANGTISALNSPTWMSFIKELVGPEQLRRAVAINSARFNLTRIIGPAIGGWLLVVAGPAACFAVDTVSFFAVLAALAAIRADRLLPSVLSAASRTKGLLAVARNPQLQVVLLPAIGLTVLVMPYSNFLPAMARDVFNSGPGGLSMLLTATGIGAICGALLSGVPFVARRPRQALAALQLVAGGMLAAFAWSPTFLLGLACIVVFGAAVIGYMTTANATIQLTAEPGTEGRALGLWIIVNQGMVPLGSLLIGVATSFVGVRTALGSAGLGCVFFGIAAVYVAQRAYRSTATPARTAARPLG
jgi:predicted MFS family arabinose efflux permease